MSFIPTAAIADKAAFTEGTTGIVPVGGEWNDSSAAVTAGQVAAFRITEKRAAHVNLRSETGTELGTSAAPVQVSIANTGANATAVKVDGSAVTQPVSGTVTANAGTGTMNVQDVADGAPASVVPAKAIQVGGSDGANLRALAMDTTGRAKVLLYDPSGNALTVSGGKLLVTPDSVALPLHQSVNVDQWNGTAPDTNSGVKSAGTLRVVLATDQPALTNKLLVTPDSVALPLHQSVNLDQLSGTAPDTNSGVKSAGTLRVVLATDQPSLTNALKVDGSAVTQPVSGTVTANAGSGTMNTADASDMTGTAPGTAPASTSIVGSKYNSAAPAPTTGQTLPQQCDLAGNLKVVPGIVSQTLAAWNSATALNATQSLISNHGAMAMLVQLDQTTTLTAGAITVEATYDGTNWVTAPVNTLVDPTTLISVANPYTVQASTNKAFVVLMNGAQQVRIRLSTVITGTGAVTPFVTYLNYDPLVTIGGQYSSAFPALANNQSAPLQLDNLGNLRVGRVGDSGTGYPDWIGNKILNGVATATSTTILSPTSGYYITAITIGVHPLCTQAVTGAVAVQFFDSSTSTIWSFYLYIPATAPTVTAPTALIISTPPGFFWNNKVAASTLSIKITNALTQGFAYTVCYGQTTIVN